MDCLNVDVSLKISFVCYSVVTIWAWHELHNDFDKKMVKIVNS